MCSRLREQARSHRGSACWLSSGSGKGLSVRVEARRVDHAAIAVGAIAAGGDFVDRPATAHEVRPGVVQENKAFSREVRVARATDFYLELFTGHFAYFTFADRLRFFRILAAQAHGQIGRASCR